MYISWFIINRQQVQVTGLLILVLRSHRYLTYIHDGPTANEGR